MIIRGIVGATFAFSLVALASGEAAAQETPPASPPAVQPPPETQGPPPVAVKHEATPSEEEEPTGDAPPGHAGFQLSIRPGIAIPSGSAAKDSSQSDTFGPQFSTTLDIGGKVMKYLFIGGYLGFGVGGSGGKLSDQCSKANATCTAVSLRIGVEAFFNILPDDKINPWVGYGIGFESSGIGVSGAGSDVTQTASGIEFAHLMGGVDFRVSRVFGIGPFLDLSLSQYSKTSVSGSGAALTGSGDIQDKAIHEWITIGAKVTFFP